MASSHGALSEEPKTTGPEGPVVVAGRTGLTSDVVRHALEGSGRSIIDLTDRTDRTDLPAPAEPAVVVLAEPTEADWASALDHDRPLVVVMDVVDDDVVVELLIRGASAVVSSASPPEHLLSAVDTVAAGGTVLDPGPATAAIQHLRTHGPKSLLKTLTRRECEILASIERGESVKQTARALGISTKTVQNLQIGLYHKLRARNRAQAVSRALEIGLL